MIRAARLSACHKTGAAPAELDNADSARAVGGMGAACAPHTVDDLVSLRLLQIELPVSHDSPVREPRGPQLEGCSALFSVVHTTTTDERPATRAVI